MQFTYEEIQSVLDKLSALLKNDKSFVSVTFTQENKITIRSLSGMSRTTTVPSTIKIVSTANQQSQEIPIEHEEGPAITSAIGKVGVDKPLKEPGASRGNIGGDECRRADIMDYYGTISFYGRIDWTVADGPCKGQSCNVPRALVSNNHVIAWNNASGGEVIWTPFRQDTAHVQCYIPFRCNTTVDLAAAAITDVQGIEYFKVRDIGVLKQPLRPTIGQKIRKHGARTFYTEGSVIGQTNIKVDGFTFYNVFMTTKGFAMPGDSGSTVVDDNNAILGIHSWGDKRADTDHTPRHGYFYPLIKPGHLTNDEDFSIADIRIDAL